MNGLFSTHFIINREKAALSRDYSTSNQNYTLDNEHRLHNACNAEQFTVNISVLNIKR
jgi:hypothetical protein